MFVEPACGSRRRRAPASTNSSRPVLVGDQVELAVAVAGLDVLEPVELVRRRPQALGEQRPVVDPQRELAAAWCANDDPLRADDVAEVQADAGARTTRRRAGPHARGAGSCRERSPRSRKAALPWPRRAAIRPATRRRSRSRAAARPSCAARIGDLRASLEDMRKRLDPTSRTASASPVGEGLDLGTLLSAHQRDQRSLRSRELRPLCSCILHPASLLPVSLVAGLRLGSVAYGRAKTVAQPRTQGARRT